MFSIFYLHIFLGSSLQPVSWNTYSGNKQQGSLKFVYAYVPHMYESQSSKLQPDMRSRVVRRRLSIFTSLPVPRPARAVHRHAESARQKRGTLSAWVEIAMARCEIGYGLKRRRERCFHGIRKRGCASVTFAGVDGRLHAPRNALDYILCTCALPFLPYYLFHLIACLFIWHTIIVSIVKK